MVEAPTRMLQAQIEWIRDCPKAYAALWILSLHPGPCGQSLDTHNKVSAPAEHLSRHATVRAGRILGIQDVTGKQADVAGQSLSMVPPPPHPLPPANCRRLASLRSGIEYPGRGVEGGKRQGSEMSAHLISPDDPSPKPNCFSEGLRLARLRLFCKCEKLA